MSKPFGMVEILLLALQQFGFHRLCHSPFCGIDISRENSSLILIEPLDELPPLFLRKRQNFLFDFGETHGGSLRPPNRLGEKNLGLLTLSYFPCFFA